MIGLQGRYAPEVRYARDLVRDGFVGEVLGTTMVGSGMVWGGEVPTRSQAYWSDNTNGASPLTSPTLHALDPLHFVLGECEAVAANLVVVGGKEARVSEDGTIVPVTVADQVSVIGTPAGGAAASVFYHGGTSRGENFRWDINGTDGDLVITSAWGNMQVACLTPAGGCGGETSASPLAVPASCTGDAPAEPAGTAAANVAHLYAAVAGDLAGNTRTVPDFAHALERHRLIDAVERASATGISRDRRTGVVA
ncbi:hypothetical protein [Amycolatopsis sp. FDAARGOS 1241]|uniref:Gfo/Idh/MocA family protein n=1 Tax=Amycolatopsis sp. FDAARGOS 1241 TaxID=2778070 RepID=UPI001951BF42|nr:hypothetical protein [Amycolatopsis sp. FDAARGOS 1241]QRP43672.1 hypothetical protein I6J71_30405 [Amycolatopsis sp. FDAARGOS 1241]